MKNKTYKRVIEYPCLVIQHDTDADSPRRWDNLGYFVTVDRDYISPDGKENPTVQSIVKDSASEANNQAEHFALIKKEIKAQLGEKVLAIYPIAKYDHSGVVYSIGTAQGFDYSNNGVYIVTDKTAKVFGTKPKDFEKVIKQELVTYNAWGNGEVYGFRLYDDNGEELDSCWGFYDLEDIKDHLPAEYKDEDLSDYLITD